MIYDKKTKEDMIISYLPLVKQVVSRIDGKNSGYEFEDLVNIGVIGLMDAIDKYDHSKKVPFEAYARIRINGSVIDELRKSGPVSRNKMEKLNRYYEAKNKLESEFLRNPTDKELCKALDIDEGDLSSIYETLHYLSSTSLETVVFSDESDGTELKDMLEDRNAVKPEDSYLDGEMKEVLASCIGKLEDRYKTLLNLYYVEELNMKEIAYILDVSIPRVSQLHGKALDKLKEMMTLNMEV